MNMLNVISAKTIGGMAMLTGTGTVLADIVPLPDGWSNWPATAIMGFVTLATLGVLTLKLKQDVACQQRTSDAILALSVSVTKAADAQHEASAKTAEVCDAMMNRPCMVAK